MSLAAAVLWLQIAHASPSHARVSFKPLPPADRYAQMNAGDYYEVLVAGEYTKVERVVERVRVQVTNGDLDDMDASYSALQATLATAKDRLEGFPPWKHQ